MAIEQHNAGLILVDVQGKLAEQMVEHQALFRQLRVMLAGAALLDIPVVWLEQLPENWGQPALKLQIYCPVHHCIRKHFPG